jgi:hypothetical protein
LEKDYFYKRKIKKFISPSGRIAPIYYIESDNYRFTILVDSDYEFIDLCLKVDTIETKHRVKIIEDYNHILDEFWLDNRLPLDILDIIWHIKI